MALYDDFGSNTIDPGKWAVGQIPGPDGDPLWTYRDPNLQVRCEDRRCSLDIPRFSLSHDHVPMFDNPKALYVSTRSWEVGREVLSFETTLAARIVNGDAQDHRDGFAAFNVLDFASGTVLDIISSGERVWAILEQLDIPGLQSSVPPFTEIIDLDVQTAPLREHSLKIEYDPTGRWARWYVDGQVRLYREVPMDPRSLQLAFGLITLHPLGPDGSTSLRGQGGTGVWGPFHVSTGAETEPLAQAQMDPATR